MIPAYDRKYLERIRFLVGRLFDIAINDIGIKLDDFWIILTSSELIKKIECADPSIIGKSGIELMKELIGYDFEYKVRLGGSKEYWLGWALAYYVWNKNVTYQSVTTYIDVFDVELLYSPYHEMDIRSFCEKLDELTGNNINKLKKRREEMGYSQKKLAEITEIPIRTIQQYEQGQKDINKASGLYLLKIKQALMCRIEDIME